VGPVRSGLAAGGNRIRTLGPSRGLWPIRAVPTKNDVGRVKAAVCYGGTEISNPVPSPAASQSLAKARPLRVETLGLPRECAVRLAGRSAEARQSWPKSPEPGLISLSARFPSTAAPSMWPSAPRGRRGFDPRFARATQLYGLARSETGLPWGRGRPIPCRLCGNTVSGAYRLYQSTSMCFLRRANRLRTICSVP
jgi:hypothetical protein